MAYAIWYHWNCGRTQRKADTINQHACPSYSLYVQLLFNPFMAAVPIWSSSEFSIMWVYWEFQYYQYIPVHVRVHACIGRTDLKEHCAIIWSLSCISLNEVFTEVVVHYCIGRKKSTHPIVLVATNVNLQDRISANFSTGSSVPRYTEVGWDQGIYKIDYFRGQLKPNQSQKIWSV